MRRLLCSISLLIVSLSMLAQTTKVCGKVLDSSTGEPLSYVSVFFVGSEEGTTTTQDGGYVLETRDTSLRVVRVELLGYQADMVVVSRGVQSNCNFSLKPVSDSIEGSYVRADNKRIKALLAALDAARGRNNPDEGPTYSCHLYSKTELDLTYPQKQERARKFLKDMGFVLDYADTCEMNGVPILPVMLAETYAQRSHLQGSSSGKEIIEANRISGVDAENNLLAQFTGSLPLSGNFYRPFINAFGVEFPSPARSGGLQTYDYYVVDSLQVEGRKTLVVRFHPKRGMTAPALDGEMLLDAEDSALRSVHARMKQGGNVNYLRTLAFDTEYCRMDDSTWFFGKEKLFADFSISLPDSTERMAVFGTRTIEFSSPDYSAQLAEDPTSERVEVSLSAGSRDERYWEAVRPSALEPREENIFRMVGEAQQTSFYKTMYKVVGTVVSGYFELGPIEIGPYHKLVSFNNLEGLRLQLGVRTTRKFSDSHRIGGYAAYGFKDHRWKGGATYEYVISRDPTFKLSLNVRRDMCQLGKSDNPFTEGNIFASIFSKNNGQRLCEQDLASASFEKEFTSCFSLAGGVALKRYYGSVYVPLPESVPSVATNELNLAARFSFQETVSRRTFEKDLLYTRYPVVTVGFTGSFSGLRENDFSFFRPEVTVNWRVNLHPVGVSRLHFNAGAVVGEVPYPLLHIHEGNGTFLMDRNAFSCMDYFEFVSDKWATLMWNHSFNGILFGWIPYVKELKLREEFSLRAAYGTLSERNRNSVIAFPQGMTAMGKTPYVEIGAGISNILSFFRVDCFWRLTHRDGASHKFVVNVGMELRF